MFKKLTFRHYFTVLGIIVALLVLFGTDPDAQLIQLAFGADVVAKLSALPAIVFGVFILHIGIKALYDFFDTKYLYDKAKETSVGAGYALIAQAISRVAVSVICVGLVFFFGR